MEPCQARVTGLEPATFPKDRNALAIELHPHKMDVLFSFQGSEKLLLTFTNTIDALGNKPVEFYECIQGFLSLSVDRIATLN